MWGQGAFAIKFYPKAPKKAQHNPFSQKGSLQGAFTPSVLSLPGDLDGSLPCCAGGIGNCPTDGLPRTKAAAKEVLGADQVAQFSSDLITRLGLAQLDTQWRLSCLQMRGGH